uniref:DUF932 domain-containing protein n=1 Tax=viral metagenome TaxID=1070528 RepID=A0A6M3L7S0_9ZZZZ
MPAEFVSGYCVREPAWHGLATVIDHYPGREEAMRLAGHNWTVSKQPIYLPSLNCVDGWKAITRDDTSQVLAVVRSSYTPIQNGALWDIIDALVQQPNVKYETAGVLRGGATLWVLARLDEPYVVPGDNTPTFPYIFAGTSHDGSRATECGALAVRIVCWNTYQAGAEQSRRAGTYFKFRHTANVMERIEDAREALAGVRSQFAEFKEMVSELAQLPVKRPGVELFVRTFIPDPELDSGTERTMNWIEEQRLTLRSMIENGRTVPDAHRQTAYGLYCAGIEFLDHERRYRSNETYFRRTVEPSRLKTKVVELAQLAAKE